MRKLALLLPLGAALALFALAVPAHAQATRTWVSGVGDDANPCSRTAPCKTFAGAISKTAAGGEINCIDPGGFGAVTITKSITIDCAGTFGSILAAGTNGIIVNGAGVVVTIRNLSINGVGSGLNGIRFLQGDRLHVDNVTIMNFTTAAPNGFAIQFAPSTASSLIVTNSYLINNGTGATGGGIQLRPSAAVSVVGAVKDSVLEFNRLGIVADGALAGGVTASVQNTLITRGGTALLATSAAGQGTVRMMLSGMMVVSNTTGISSVGGPVAIFVGTSVVSSNGTGVSIAGGQVLSYKNNQIDINTTDGTPLTQRDLN
jgi:hypothetical protein